MHEDIQKDIMQILRRFLFENLKSVAPLKDQSSPQKGAGLQFSAEKNPRKSDQVVSTTDDNTSQDRPKVIRKTVSKATRERGRTDSFESQAL